MIIMNNENAHKIYYNIPRFRLLTEFEMVSWMKTRLLPHTGEDDLILEIVVFIGTCASDESAAIYLCKSDILPSLIELLKAKQEDDEIVLQVIYVFYQLCSHAVSRQFVKVRHNYNYMETF